MTATQANDPAPAPPRAGIDWQLAPVAFIWFGKGGAEICAQLKDPKRNGGRDAVGLLVHLRHYASLSGFVPRGWEPGAGRTTPPGTFEDHVKDVVGSRRATLSELTTRRDRSFAVQAIPRRSLCTCSRESACPAAAGA